MATINWMEFYDSMSLDTRFGVAVEKPGIEQLNQFESTTGFRLPQSYREFILIFGPGEFSASLRIAAPGYSNITTSTNDLATANEAFGYRGNEVRSFPLDQQERLNRLYYFGLLNGREWLGWDLQDVRDSAAHEYGIYRVGLRTMELAAVSFSQLIETVCETLFTPDPDWDDEELGPQRCFQPETYQQY